MSDINAEQFDTSSKKPVGRGLPPLRLRYLTEQIYQLGERPLFELFTELTAGADPVDRIERYARLSRELGGFIRANGGNQFSSRLFSIPNLSVANGTY
jgi:hypothetical protein